MKQVLIFASLVLLAAGLYAQSADRPTVASAGDYFVLNASFNFQSTVGESVIQTFQTPSLIFTQGFQQPEQIINLPVPSGGIPSDVSIYPNPAIDQVKIQFNLDVPAWMSFLLVNNAGQIIRKLPLAFYQAGPQVVPFDFHLPAGLYLLTLSYEGRNITYKVVVQ